MACRFSAWYYWLLFGSHQENRELSYLRTVASDVSFSNLSKYKGQKWVSLGRKIPIVRQDIIMSMNNTHNDKTSRMILDRGSISAEIYTSLPQLEE